MWKKLLRFVVKCTIGLCVLGVVLFWLITTKGQVDSRSLSSQDVVDSHQLVSSTLQQLRFSQNGIEVELAQPQLDALLNVASHTLHPVVFHGALGDFGVVVHVAMTLPRPFEQRLLHGYCLFSETRAGFAIDSCQLGKLPVPGMLAMLMLRTSVRIVFASPSDQQLLALLQQGRLSDGRLVFRQPDVSDIDLQLNPRLYSGRQLGRELLGTAAPLAPDVDVYLAALERLAEAYPQERRLAFFTQQLLLLALERSASEAQQEYEYRQALWALATGFGNRGFIRFANDGLGREAVPKLPGVVLAGRRDLTLHFLYSAVIKQVGNPYLADQIGRLKEIHDAADGGSGYSFVDIAANKAGIWFAEHLHQIDDVKVLTLDTAAFERAFFPEVRDLPEGLSEAQVQLLLGGLQGDGFQAVHQLIDSRVSELTLFKPD
ncbi:hypothetical protein [Alkalimonas amylolytica]|uniref:Uncharacterized protein n=1 Tax=Alkalimonas amylolytica TaxID=152573 RepID=A0A1H4CCP5_ALKAM|nr:hypothetical protein [Alkalimonas amylolytica]SEA57862.1 hypothetical protein SAMN04488051_10484 [Alkalimonas amylolytica]